MPEAVHHVEELEEVDEDHGVRWSVQTLMLHLGQRHRKVDQALRIGRRKETDTANHLRVSLHVKSTRKHFLRLTCQGCFVFVFQFQMRPAEGAVCAEKVNQAHSDMYEVCHQYQSMSIHALDRHLCLDVTHPANQTGAHLAEELQVKVPDARVELTSFEKVINHIPWREKRQRNEQIIFYSILFLQDNGQNKINSSEHRWGNSSPSYRSSRPVPAPSAWRSESARTGRR